MKKVVSAILVVVLVLGSIMFLGACAEQEELKRVVSFSLLNKIYDNRPDKTDDDELTLTEFKTKVTNMISENEQRSDVILKNAQVENENYDTNRLIIKSEKEELEEFEAVSYINGYNDLHIMQFETDEECDKALEYYEDKDYVEYVQEDGICESVDYNPMQEVSDEFGYTALRTYLTDNNINYTNQITVAVVDSGVENDHPLLQGRVQPTGFNSIDENDDCYDDRGHGTHVAGIIAANTEDNVVIKPYKVLNAKGQGTELQVYTGIIQAVNDGVDIINLSLSIIDESDVLHDGVKAAYDAGIVTVAAAGNNGISLDQVYTSPACFDEVICVMSCGNNKYVSEFSNYGSYCDLAAPGEKIVSSWLNGTYEAKSGTSMATPFIVAATAYILSEYPDYTQEDVLNKLLENVKPCYSTPVGRYINAEYITREKQNTAAPRFSNLDTYFSEPFELTLTSTEADAQIYYSTSEMAKDEFVLYTNPISIVHDIEVTAYAIRPTGKKSYNLTMSYIKTATSSSYFTIDETGALTGYTGTDPNPVVPLKVNGEYVTSVADGAFENNSELQSIALLSRVESIGANAFKGCEDLEYVRASSVAEVGAEAFAECPNLCKLTLDKCANVGDKAFYNCPSLYSLSFTTVQSIGASAFANCSSLETIGNNYVMNIGEEAFINTPLITINLLNTKNIGARAFYGCSELLAFEAPLLESLAEGVISGCDKLTSIDVGKCSTIDEWPNTQDNEFLVKFNANNISAVPDNAFKDCINLREVNFENATIIGEYAFCNTALKNANFNGVNEIKSYAFYGTNEDINLSFPCLITVGDYAFYNSSITHLIANEATHIGSNAFEGCKNLQTVNIPKSLVIGADAFLNCPSIETLKIGETSNSENFEINVISGSTDNIKTLELNLAKTITEDGVQLARNPFPKLESFTALVIDTLPVGFFEISNNIKNITIPNLVLVEEQFKNCKNLESVDVNKIKEIPDYCFYGCENLTTFAKANNVSRIGSYAFFECKKLSIIELGSVATAGDYAFYNCSSLNTIKHAFSNVGAYSFAGTKINSLEKAVANIGDYAFKDSMVTSVSVGTGTIGKGIVEGAYNLKTLTISCSEITTDQLFGKDKGNLEKYTELEQVKCSFLTTIPESFLENSLVKTVTLGNNNKTISDNAFKNCKNLESVGTSTLDIGTIGDSAFEGCEKLTTINQLYSSLRYLGDRAFANCTAFVVPSAFQNLIELGSEAFCNVPSFFNTGVRFWNLLRIEQNAFESGNCQENPDVEYVFYKVTEIHDLPDNCSVLIGTVTETIDNCEDVTSTIYAPVGNAIVRDYCNENKLNYLEYNGSTGVVSLVTLERCVAIFSVRGFNIKYQWYQSNNKDLSGATAIDGGQYQNLNYKARQPYVYCVATSEENGNTVKIQSPVLVNPTHIITTGSSCINYENSDYISTKLEEITPEKLEKVFSLPEGYTYKLEPSVETVNGGLYGTGTKIKIYYGDANMLTVTLFVLGDVNGDSIVDGLDDFLIMQYNKSNGNTLAGDYRAADLWQDGVYDSADEKILYEKILD